jgi:hypothetical protein
MLLVHTPTGTHTRAYTHTHARKHLYPRNTLTHSDTTPHARTHGRMDARTHTHTHTHMRHFLHYFVFSQNGLYTVTTGLCCAKCLHRGIIPLIFFGPVFHVRNVLQYFSRCIWPMLMIVYEKCPPTHSTGWQICNDYQTIQVSQQNIATYV